MSESEPGPKARAHRDVVTGLRKLIDAHGHGFQYACLKRAGELFGTRSKWHFVAAEVPVEVREHATRVDFILKHADEPLFLVVECKRANPRLSRWAFARAPYVHRERHGEPYIAERVQRRESFIAVDGTYLPKSFERAYHLAYELKNAEATGEPVASGRGGAIEDAASQVARAMSGMASFLVENPAVVGLPENILDVKEAILLPAVFTTAEIWASDDDLAAADLSTGKLTSDVNARQVEWLPYQYHLSPGVKHRIKPLA